MTQIQLISTSIVRPTRHTGQLVHRVELTPWDLALLKYDYIQAGLLFHQYCSSENEVNQISLVQHLMSSLSQALDIFYPLAGRLAVTENQNICTACVFIDCNNAGVEFCHVAADCIRVADILDSGFILDDILLKLFPLNDVRNCEGISKPLLAVQVTELVDGIFMGFTTNHSVMDGISLSHFLNTWSKIARSGSDHQMIPPIYHRQLFDGEIDLPIHIPVPFPYNEILPSHQQPIHQSPSESIHYRIFHISKEKVAQLKAKANAEMGTNNISTFQALIAHFCSATIRNTPDLNPDQEVFHVIPIELRQRLKPPLPIEYFGNAIQGLPVKSTADELIQNEIGWTALHINKSIASFTSDDERKWAEEFAKNPFFLPNRSDIVQTCNTQLLTIGSPRFNVYDTDFGWGRPLCFRRGSVRKKNAHFMVYSGDKEGSIDFTACLFQKTLQAMVGDAEFMDAILYLGTSGIDRAYGRPFLAVLRVGLSLAKSLGVGLLRRRGVFGSRLGSAPRRSCFPETKYGAARGSVTKYVRSSCNLD